MRGQNALEYLFLAAGALLIVVFAGVVLRSIVLESQNQSSRGLESLLSNVEQLKLADNSSCTANAACYSGNCLNGVCRPAGATATPIPTATPTPIPGPSVSSVILNSSSGTNTTSENLTLYFSTSNAVTNVTDWRISGTSMAVLNMPFENSSGSVKDYSTRNKTITTVGNVEYVTGYNGRAFNSTSNSDYLEIFEDWVPTEYSIAMWVKPRNIASGQFVYLSDGGGGASHALDVSSSHFRHYTYDSGGFVTGTTTVVAENWYYVVGTAKNNDFVRLYVNGVEEGTPRSIGIMWTGGNRWRLGNALFSSFGDATIDELKIYNRSLTAQQIQAIYQGRNDLIVSQETEVGDVWSAAVTPNNGTVDGSTVLSNNLTIVATVPTVSSVVLNSSSGTNTTSENLTLYFSTSNAITNVTDWRVNGTSIALVNLPFEADGANNATDYSYPSQLAMSVEGAVWNGTFGVSGGSFQFDGVDDIIVNSSATSDLPQGSQSFSLTAWINPSRTNDGDLVVNFGTDGGAQAVHFIFRGSSQICFDYFGDTGTTCGDALTTGRWYFLVGTYDGTNMRLYVDGVLKQTTAASLDIGAGQLNIGRWPSQGPPPYGLTYQGFIDEVRVYNRTLSANEIILLNRTANNVMHSDETVVGDVWSAAVTPNNGTVDGATVLSNNLTIVAAVPTVFSFLDTNSTHFGQGVFYNTTFYGVGSEANVSMWQPPVANTSEQVGYWKFDNASSFGENNTRAFDYSLNGNNGSISGAVYADGKFGRALSFDGSDDYVDAGGSVSSTGDRSIEYWFKANSISTTQVHVYVESSSNTDYLVVGQFNSKILASQSASTTYSRIGTTTLSNDNWYHVVVTKTSSSVQKVYVNGIDVTDAGTDFFSGGTTKTAVGATFYSGSPSANFNGTIDNVIVYNRTLSSGEVLEKYNRGAVLRGAFERVFDAGSTVDWNSINWTTALPYQQEAPLESALLAYWKFNNNTAVGDNGTNALDYSGNGYNGTLTSGPTVADGQFGRALSFDGVDDYVNVGNLGSFPGNGTISFWMYPIEVASYRNPFTTDLAGANAGIRFEEATGGTFLAVVGDGGGGYTVGTYTTALTTGRWYHVIFTWSQSASNVKGYLDGALAFSYAQTGWPTGLPDVKIGLGFSSNPLDGRYFNGSIDDVTIYNRSLSDSEILDNYKKGILNVTLQTATSADNSTYSSLSSVYYANQSNGTAIEGSNSRYLKYLVNFTTEDISYGPILQSVAVNSS